MKIGVWRAPVIGSGWLPAWIIRVSNPNSGSGRLFSSCPLIALIPSAVWP